LPWVEPKSDSANADSVSNDAYCIFASWGWLVNSGRNRSLTFGKCFDVVEDPIKVHSIELHRDLNSGELSEVNHRLCLLLTRHGAHYSSSKFYSLTLFVSDLLSVKHNECRKALDDGVSVVLFAGDWIVH
jgi:hypothetical protein